MPVAAFKPLLLQKPKLAAGHANVLWSRICRACGCLVLVAGCWIHCVILERATERDLLG